jgi:hypothetical protein
MGTLKCPECETWHLDNRRLGLHRRNAHGIPGAHTHNRSKRKTKRRAISGVGDLAVNWLQENPGPHHYKDVGQGVSVSPERIIKILSSAKQAGAPIANDGHGNWSYSPNGHNLPAKAPQRPVERPEANGKVHFTSQRIVLLLTDTEGREWVAEPR